MSTNEKINKNAENIVDIAITLVKLFRVVSEVVVMMTGSLV